MKAKFLPAMAAAGIPCPLVLVEGSHDYQTARAMLITHVLPTLFRPQAP